MPLLRQLIVSLTAAEPLLPRDMCSLLGLQTSQTPNPHTIHFLDDWFTKRKRWITHAFASGISSHECRCLFFFASITAAT